MITSISMSRAPFFLTSWLICFSETPWYHHQPVSFVDVRSVSASREEVDVQKRSIRLGSNRFMEHLLEVDLELFQLYQGHRFEESRREAKLKLDWADVALGSRPKSYFSEPLARTAAWRPPLVRL